MSLKLLRQSLALDEKCESMISLFYSIAFNLGASNNESNQKKLSGRQRRKRAKQAQRARFINKINSISKFVPLQGFSTVEQCRNEETPHIAKLNERYLKFTERTRVDTNVGENLMRRMMEQMNADQKKLARRKDIGSELL